MTKLIELQNENRACILNFELRIDLRQDSQIRNNICHAQFAQFDFALVNLKFLSIIARLTLFS